MAESLAPKQQNIPESSQTLRPSWLGRLRLKMLDQNFKKKAPSLLTVWALYAWVILIILPGGLSDVAEVVYLIFPLTAVYILCILVFFFIHDPRKVVTTFWVMMGLIALLPIFFDLLAMVMGW